MEQDPEAPLLPREENRGENPQPNCKNLIYELWLSINGGEETLDLENSQSNEITKLLYKLASFYEPEVIYSAESKSQRKRIIEKLKLGNYKVSELSMLFDATYPFILAKPAQGSENMQGAAVLGTPPRMDPSIDSRPPSPSTFWHRTSIYGAFFPFIVSCLGFNFSTGVVLTSLTGIFSALVLPRMSTHRSRIAHSQRLFLLLFAFVFLANNVALTTDSMQTGEGPGQFKKGSLPVAFLLEGYYLYKMILVENRSQEVQPHFLVVLLSRILFFQLKHNEPNTNFQYIAPSLIFAVAALVLDLQFAWSKLKTNSWELILGAICTCVHTMAYYGIFVGINGRFPEVTVEMAWCFVTCLYPTFYAMGVLQNHRDISEAAWCHNCGETSRVGAKLHLKRLVNGNGGLEVDNVAGDDEASDVNLKPIFDYLVAIDPLVEDETQNVLSRINVGLFDKVKRMIRENKNITVQQIEVSLNLLNYGLVPRSHCEKLVKSSVFFAFTVSTLIVVLCYQNIQELGFNFLIAWFYLCPLVVAVPLWIQCIVALCLTDSRHPDSANSWKQAIQSTSIVSLMAVAISFFLWASSTEYILFSCARKPPESAPATSFGILLGACATRPPSHLTTRLLGSIICAFLLLISSVTWLRLNLLSRAEVLKIILVPLTQQGGLCVLLMLQLDLQLPDNSNTPLLPMMDRKTIIVCMVLFHIIVYCLSSVDQHMFVLGQPKFRITTSCMMAILVGALNQLYVLKCPFIGEGFSTETVMIGILFIGCSLLSVCLLFSIPI
jgi:hypothetical protein